MARRVTADEVEPRRADEVEVNRRADVQVPAKGARAAAQESARRAAARERARAVRVGPDKGGSGQPPEEEQQRVAPAVALVEEVLGGSGGAGAGGGSGAGGGAGKGGSAGAAGGATGARAAHRVRPVPVVKLVATPAPAEQVDKVASFRTAAQRTPARQVAAARPMPVWIRVLGVRNSTAATMVHRRRADRGASEFNEGSGTTSVDSSGNGNDLTLTSPQWVAGKNGGGARGLICPRISAGDKLNAVGVPFSIAGWLKFDQVTHGNGGQIIFQSESTVSRRDDSADSTFGRRLLATTLRRVRYRA